MSWATIGTAKPGAAPSAHSTKAPLARVREVRLDGLVVLKIIKHCQENFPQAVAGSLLGLDVEEVLEVTHRYVHFSDATLRLLH